MDAGDPDDPSRLKTVYLPISKPALERAEREVERISAAQARLQDQLAQLKAAMAPLSVLSTACRRFLDNLGSQEARSWNARPLKLKGSVSIPAVLEKDRLELARLVQERTETVEALIPLDEGYEEIERRLEHHRTHHLDGQLAASILNPDPGSRYATRDLFVTEGRSVNPEQVERRVIPTILASVSPDALRQWLRRIVEEHAKGQPVGLPRAKRAARLAELDHAIEALEVREEQLIREGEQRGLEVGRRGDARPEVVLADLEAAA